MNKYTYRRDDEHRFLRHVSMAIEGIIALCILLAIIHHIL